MLFQRDRRYTINKCRHILKTAYKCYKKKWQTLDPNLVKHWEEQLEKLNQAILSKNRDEADLLARKVESFMESHCKKSWFEYGFEVITALAFALVIAAIVRQSWFEPYEIPTGSMRPTFEEKDHVTVSKLTFGINVPLATSHFYFDPNAVQRTSIAIFSGEGMPVIDQSTTYFYLIPYKKRYIKRMIAKPGDSIYFYGGQIYAIDEEGKWIQELQDSPWMKKLEYIPFLSFEGLVSSPTGAYILFNQMHLPIGKLSPSPSGTLLGEVYDGKNWVKDNPQAQMTPHSTIQTYSDFLGMKNYAMARLLTKQQLEKTPFANEKLEEAPLYLELRHTPSLNYPKPRLEQKTRGGMAISLSPYTTIIPLQQHLLDTLMDHLYTARFVVSNGKATRYNVEGNRFYQGNPTLPNVKDGTYEFYYGKGFEVGLGAITYPLPKDHPLYSHDPSQIQKLFNLGIEWDLAFSPSSSNKSLYPSRYAYFRNGDLYLMGAPLLKKEDPTLIEFLKREEEREKASTETTPYIAFKDYGPPIKKDGTIDAEFIKTFGVTIPDRHYLVLGDNHAMSADSRIFGFVPEDNLQGAPSLIIWPPGDRMGPPQQKPYPILTWPRLIVWGLALLIFLAWFIMHNRRKRKGLFFNKIDKQKDRKR